jgi:hypothetical protein
MVSPVGQAKVWRPRPEWGRAGTTGMGSMTARTRMTETGSSTKRWVAGDTPSPRMVAPSSAVNRKPRLQAPWQLFITRMPVAASTRSASTLTEILVSEKAMPLSASSTNKRIGLATIVTIAARVAATGSMARVTAWGPKRSMMRLEKRNMQSAPSGWPISAMPSWDSLRPIWSWISGMRVWMAPMVTAWTKNIAMA